MKRYRISGKMLIVCGLLIVLTLIKHSMELNMESNNDNRDIKKEEDVQITIKRDFNTQKESEEDIPEYDYHLTLEEAMKKGRIEKDEATLYQKNIDEIIMKFENDDYVTIYFRSIKDKSEECFTMAKFKKKEIDGTMHYSFRQMKPTVTNRGELIINNYELLIRNQILFCDYLQVLNINKENRFVYGDIRSDAVYSLKIEGQKPTGIVEYEVFGETWYFWYYENLISDKSSQSLKITFDER